MDYSSAVPVKCLEL
jgi:16S rRNA (cytosine967-C5)-methyltransferase